MNRHIVLGTVAVGLLLPPITAFARPIIDLPRPGAPQTPGQQLQDAVNDPANAGARIRLARGAYQLDPSRPNGGRLFLQPGMDIVGENAYADCDGDGVWDPIGACSEGPFDPDRYTVDDSETLIDGTQISSALSGAAVIRGGGDNRLSKLTIRAPRRQTVGGSLDVNLAPPGEGMEMSVQDVIVEGGQRGIRCNNGAPPRSGISSTIVVERSILRNNLPVPGGLFGFGFQLQNSGATGSTWKVTLRHNRILDSRFGLFVLGSASTDAETDVFSQGNLIHDNQADGFLMTAFSPGGSTAESATENSRIRFISQNDMFLNNVTPPDQPAFLALGGGIVAFAEGRDSETAPANSGNELVLQFLHSTFKGNVGVPGPLHLTVVGSFSSPISQQGAGGDNHVKLLMRDTASDGEPNSFIVANSIPGDPSGSNRVTVLGSEVGFVRTNSGWDTPPAEYFSEGTR